MKKEVSEKKRILIVNNNMHIGGVQKALVNLLKEIHSAYSVTLLLFYRGGELLGEIPDDVEILTPSSLFRYWGMTRNDMKNGWDVAWRALFAALHRILGRGGAFFLPRLLERRWRGYDVAISFLHSGPKAMFYGGCNEFVCHCVDAGRKVTFLHCDYREIRAQSRYNAKLYAQFDRIAACSDGTKEAFLSCLPSLAKRTMTVRNCQDYVGIRRLAASAPEHFPHEWINVVTVARLGREKGVSRALWAMAKLGETAKRMRYYIVGDGTEREEVLATTSKLGLQKQVVLVGERANPYGYMAAADVLLIPSLSEAAPMVIGEVACLGTPVLATETCSAREMVEETGFGWVCENSIEGIAEGLRELVKKPWLLEERRAHLTKMHFDNEGAHAQFEELVDGDGKRDKTDNRR